MYDTHYDLLTYLYVADKENLTNYFKKLNYYFNEKNVEGVIANLYFMSPLEMKERLNLENFNVVEMFSAAKELVKKIDVDYLLSIEGCDYIKDEKQLEDLYELGLNSFLLTWNNPNKYGSGSLGNYGLTDEGRKFIRKAIDLNMGIDLSHANEKTFNDIITLAKKQSKDPIIYASHSNIKALNNHHRNLSDEQLGLLKSVNGYLGLVAYPPFISQNNVRECYMEHIKYAVDKLGSEHVMLASDNMDFENFLNKNEELNSLYMYETMCMDIKQDLFKIFDIETCQNILKDNAKTLFKKIQTYHY